MEEEKQEVEKQKIENKEVDQEVLTEKESLNLEIFNKVKDVPENAKKQITGGRLKGMTDIKPMWRIKTLTKIFGVCGFGWKTIIKNKMIIDGANNEKIAIVDIELYVKHNGQWSEPIEGTGGSSFIAREKSGLYTSDECFKMAYTDALSVACRSLGIGAEVYYGDSKYPTTPQNTNSPRQPQRTTKAPVIKTKEDAAKYVVTFGKCKGMTIADIIENDKEQANYLYKHGDAVVKQCLKIMSGK